MKTCVVAEFGDIYGCFFAILPWERKIHLRGGMIIHGCVIYTGLNLGPMQMVRASLWKILFCKDTSSVQK